MFGLLHRFDNSAALAVNIGKCAVLNDELQLCTMKKNHNWYFMFQLKKKMLRKARMKLYASMFFYQTNMSFVNECI